MQKKKYKVLDLGIEVTRRCNKACPHCARGDAQDLTISEAMINRMIEAVDDVRMVRIGNGEALLELDRIEYLIRKINESSWNVIYIEVTTNGSILDRRIIDAFESFCGSGHGKRVAIIRISNDQFHNEAEFERAYEYYSSAAKEANERLRQKVGKRIIHVHYTLESGSREIEHIWYEGRAVNYIKRGQDGYAVENISSFAYPCLYKHRICVKDSTIGCALQITVNGDVTFFEEVSYEHLDEMAIGNVAVDNLVDIVDRHNASCLLLCNELDILRNIDAREQWAALKGETIGTPRIDRIMCHRVLDLRNKAKSLYPNLSVQTIMERLKFPKSMGGARGIFGKDAVVLNSIFGSVAEGANDNSKVMGCNDGRSVQEMEAEIENGVRSTYEVAWVTGLIADDPTMIKLKDIVLQSDAVAELDADNLDEGGDVTETVNSLLPGLLDAMEKDGTMERVRMIAQSERNLREIKGNVEPALIHLQLVDAVIHYVKLNDGKVHPSDINSFRAADCHIGKMRLLYQGLTESDRQLYHDYLAAEHNTTWEALDERFTRYGLVSISHRDTQSDDELIRVIESLVEKGVEQ